MAIKIFEDFSGGLNKDKDPAMLADNEAAECIDVDPRFNKITKLPGLTDETFGATVPAGVNWKGGLQIKMTRPSEQTVTFLHGLDASSGRHRIFAIPYIEDGAWVTNAWLELTEEVSSTTETGTTTDQTAAPTDLGSYADGYFDNWFYHNTTEDNISQVYSFVSSTGIFQLRNSMTGNTVGDTFTLSRWDGDLNDSVPIRLVPGDDESVLVLSGGEDDYANTATVRPVSDAKIQYINRSFFNDDYSVDDMFMSRNNLDGANHESGSKPLLVNIAKVSDYTDDPWPEGRYLFLGCPIYDGFQEGPPHEGQGTEPYSLYNALFNINLTIASGEATHGPEIDIGINIATTGSEDRDLKNREGIDYRLSGVAVYCAEIVSNGVTNEYTLSGSAFKRVATIDINDSGWSEIGRGYHNLIDQRIGYASFTNGDTAANIQGHSSYRTSMNTRFAVSVAEQNFFAYTYPDQERADFIVATPISGDGPNWPDVKPWTDTLDVSQYGITRVVGLFESLKHLIIVGENRVIRYNPITGQVARILVQRGAVAENGQIEVNGLIFFCASDEIYMISTIGSFEQEGERMTALCDRQGKGGILSDYQALSSANKEGASVGYDRDRNALLFSFGSFDKWVYFIDINCWVEYDGGAGSRAFDALMQSYDGRIIALDGNDVESVFASIPTENNSFSWKSKKMIGPIRMRRLRLHSNKTENVTYAITDTEETVNPGITGTYRTFQTERTGVEASKDFKSWQIQVQSPASGILTHELHRIELKHDETGVR